VPQKENTISENLSKLQKKTAVLPDYSLPSKGEEENPSWPAVNPGRSVSGILGGLMVLGVVLLFGIGIKVMRKFREKT